MRMNGLSLIIEISGLQQFLKVDQEAFENLIRNCVRCLNNTAKSRPLISNSFIIFDIETDEKNYRAVYESAVSILEIIAEFSDEIHEYSMMLLEREGRVDDDFITGLKQGYYIKCVDSGLLIENKIAKLIGVEPGTGAVEGYSLVTTEGGQPGCGSPDIRSSAAPEGKINELVGIIIPETEQESSGKKIIIKSDFEPLVYGTVEAALRVAAGKEKTEYTVIRVLKDEKETVMPFRRSIEPGFAVDAEQYLSGIELETWKSVSERFSHVASDYPEQSFFIPFCLYLKALANKMKSRLVPFLIILKGIDNAPDGFIDFLNKSLRYVETENELFVIAVCGNGINDVIKIAEKLEFDEFDVYNCCETPERSRAAGISYIHRKILFNLMLTEGLFEKKVQEAFLIESGYSPGEIVAAIGCLSERGYIKDGRNIEVFHSELMSETFDDLTGMDEIYSNLALFISENIYKNLLFDFALASERLKSAVSNEKVSLSVYLCLSRLLDINRIEYVDSYLADCGKLNKDFFTALKLRCCLLSGDPEGSRMHLERVPDRPESPVSLSEAVMLLETARYFHAVCDYQRALDCVKKVLIFVQDDNYPDIEGAAFLELGTIMLAKGKMLESAEYLSLAVDKLSTGGDGFSLMKALLFSGFGKYLWGSYDSSLEFTEKAAAAAASGGYEDWLFYAGFFRCRLYFELGRYYDAEKMLAECLLNNEKYRNADRRKLFSAWAARACVYQGKVYRGISMLKALPQDPEVLFFTAEAHYLSGNLDLAIETIGQAAEMTDYFELGFDPLELIRWKNGFVSIEGRFLRSSESTGILFHNIRAIQAFFTGLAGDREFGIEILFNLTRDQKISENDPYNRLYFYFYAMLIDRRNDSDIVDKLTLISKALKYLQQTSSRINIPSVRQEFMMKNYWNSRLVEEAKREKLI